MFKKIQERYTNEKLHKQVKEGMFGIYSLAILLISVFLIVHGLFATYIQKKAKDPIPFETLTNEPFFNIYYAELTDMPESLGRGYYLAQIDDNIVILYFGSIGLFNNVKYELGTYGHATVHGSLKFVDESVNSIIEKNSELKKYKNDSRYVCVSCYDKNLWSETIERNAAGIVFGITGFIVLLPMIDVFGPMHVFRLLRPACGSKRYTIEEINEQANMEDSLWLHNYGVYLTPKIMIGTANGITVVEYSDIASIGVKQVLHFKRIRKRLTGDFRLEDYREYYTYQLIVKTKGGKKLKFTNSDYDPSDSIIYERCLEGSPDLVMDYYNF